MVITSINGTCHHVDKVFIHSFADTSETFLVIFARWRFQQGRQWQKSSLLPFHGAFWLEGRLTHYLSNYATQSQLLGASPASLLSICQASLNSILLFSTHLGYQIQECWKSGIWSSWRLSSICPFFISILLQPWLSCFSVFFNLKVCSVQYCRHLALMSWINMVLPYAGEVKLVQCLEITCC